MPSWHRRSAGEYLIREIALALDVAFAARPAPPPDPTNEAVARQVVAEIKNFRSVVPFGKSWEAFATAEVLVALNAASRQVRP